MKHARMPVSVHLTSKNGMQVFENADGFFCLRSKRSVVRIHSGVPNQTLHHHLRNSGFG